MKQKGVVEAVGFVFLMGLTIIITLLMFFLVAYEGSPAPQTIERSIDYRMGEIEARSTVQTAMEDQIWREVDGLSRSQAKYNHLRVYKLISYWLSTSEGEKVHVNNNSIPEDEIENDLEEYMQNRLSGIFIQERANPRYYNVSILYTGGRYDNKGMFITPENYNRGDNAMTVIEYLMAVRGQERALVRIGVAEGAVRE